MGVKRLLMFDDAKDEMEEFTHGGANDD